MIPQQTNREGYTMKLAEALQERADLNRNIEQLSRAAGVSDLQDQPDQFPDKGGWPDLNGADRKKGCADSEDRCI